MCRACPPRTGLLHIAIYLLRRGCTCTSSSPQPAAHQRGGVTVQLRCVSPVGRAVGWLHGACCVHTNNMTSSWREQSHHRSARGSQGVAGQSEISLRPHCLQHHVVATQRCASNGHPLLCSHCVCSAVLSAVVRSPKLPDVLSLIQIPSYCLVVAYPYRSVR
jgi:hypothetical protein